MIYWLHLVGSWLSRWLPLWFSYGLSELLAPTVVFGLWQEKRECAIQNLTQVLGPEANPAEVRRIARRSFVNYGKYLIDMMRLGDELIEGEQEKLRVEGWDRLVQAFDRGKGLIFVGGHIGNSDLGAALLARRGFPVSVITEPLSPPRWDRLVQQARAAAGLHVISMGSAMLRALRVLRDHQILAVLLDRPVQDQGVTIEFFGRRTQVPGGAAALAVRSGASVVGGYIIRSGNQYIAGVSPEIVVPETGNRDNDVQTLTQRMFSWLEQVIRDYPDQWFMFRPMWPEAPSS